MSRRLFSRGSIAALALAALVVAGPAAAQRVRLQGSVPPNLASATAIGALDPARELEFAITLPVRDPKGLTEFLQAVYQPGNPLYRHYLATGEFGARFGPTVDDYDAVAAFAESQGLRVTRRFSSRTVLDVAGPVATIERALGLRMLEYRAADGRRFHSPDSEPAFPADVARRIEGVVGLDDANPMRPNLARISPVAGGPRRAGPAAQGTGRNNQLAPVDIRAMYNLTGVTQTGTTNTLALFELDGYTLSDVRAYEDQYGLPHVGMLNVLLDGVTGTPTQPTATNPFPSGPIEVTIDIDLGLALAPGIHQIDVYEGTNPVNVFNQIANDNSAQVVSCSWGIGEGVAGSSLRTSENTAFQQMATQGQTLFVASGDNGDQACTAVDVNGKCTTFGVAVQNPASQPYCTGVGGTIVTTDVAGGPWKSETAWSGSGGGISTIWTLPYYQSAGVMPGSSGSDTWRNVPDVSLDANSGYSCSYNGTWLSVTGTSCGAPLWAAFTALANQYRSSRGYANLGFINPALYFLGYSNRGVDFHDITTGNNGTYAAVPGYDDATGWGSFNGANLLTDLSIDVGVSWVDGNYGGITQNGTPLFPYHSIDQAVAFAPAGVPYLIYVRGAAYPTNFSITKDVVIVNNGGGVVSIGQ